MADDFLKSALKTAGRGAMSGLGAVGNVLDLPGSMVRDALSLKNPFDQLLTPFGDENRTTGRDMLRQYGLADKEKDTWGNWAAGLALEFGTDPLTYVGIPGLSKAATTAGKVGTKAGIVSDDIVRAAAKKSGQAMATAKTLGTRARMETTLRDVLEHVAKRETERFPNIMDDIAVAAKSEGVALKDILDSPMGGLTTFQVPFLKKTERVLGTAASPTALKIADAVDTAHDYLRYNPVSNAIVPLFSKSVKGYGEKLGQISGSTATRGEKAAEAASRADVYEPLREIDASGLLKGKHEDVLNNANQMRRGLEGVGATDPAVQAVQPTLDKLSGLMGKARQKELAMGLKSDELGDAAQGVSQYFPRTKNEIAEPATSLIEQIKGKGLVLSSYRPSQIARKKILTGLPGGTDVLQRISVDPEFSGIATKRGSKLTLAEAQQQAKKLLAKYPEAAYEPAQDALESFARSKFRIPLGTPITPQDLASAKQVMQGSRARKLANYAADLAEAHVDQKQPLFNLDPINDATKRLKTSGEAIGNTRAFYNYLADAAEDVATPGSSTAWDMLKRPGLSRSQAAQQIVYEMSGTAMSPDDAKKFLQSKHIPKRYADDMNRVYRPFQEPQEVSKAMQHVDRFTRSFKAMVTSAFPSFAARNRVSGAAQNFLGEAGDARRAGPMAYIGPANDAEAMLAGEVIQGASEMPFAKARGLDDKAATEFMRKMGYANKWGGAAQGMFGDDMTDVLASSMEQVPGGIKDKYDFRTPKAAYDSVSQHVSDMTPRSMEQANPLNLQGVGADKDMFSPIVAGKALGRHGESVNRLSGAMGYMSQGYSPGAASDLVNKYHVDYNDLTDFERQYMRRLFPFYSFTKGAAKQVADDLLTKPGGRLRQTMRVSDSLKGDDPTTPDYVADTAAIPLGQSEDGTKRYITGFGLAFEDPLSFAGGGLRGAGLEALSRANPLVKGPIEYSTGQTFFQKEPGGGRSLADADPTLGRLLANVSGRKNAVKFPGSEAVEVGLSNSPVARVLSTARSVTDTRKSLLSKAVNNITGIRVSDISPAAQDAVIRDKLDVLLRKYPESRRYTKTFINKEELAAMSPERREEMQSLQEMMNELGRRASRRAKAAKEKQLIPK